MVLLTEREIIHLINAVKKHNNELKRNVKKLQRNCNCKEMLNGNTEASELLDILICTLFNSNGDNFKTVQLQNAAI